jgi:hypothetical protein
MKTRDSEWGIQFAPRQIVNLQKTATEIVRVQVESLTICTDGEVMYTVREIDTREGYPALQTSLKAIPLTTKVGAR